MKIKDVLAEYEGIENQIPEEVLNIKVGDKPYDKKYLKIKQFFKENLSK